MQICKTDTEIKISVNLDLEDITILPESMQECCNGIYKYTKAEKIYISLFLDYCFENRSIENIQYVITVENGLFDSFTTSFMENEDYKLTEQEKKMLGATMLRFVFNEVQITA